MRKELENELCEIDPIFYEDLIACKNKKKDQMDTCMYWGCECGDGWFMPLAKLAEKTAFLNKVLSDYKTDAKLTALQIKEKFAELTIYEIIRYPVTEGKELKLTDEQNNVIDMVHKIYIDLYRKTAHDCYYKCEICGHDNDKNNPIVTTKGWLSRICKECAEQNKKDYNL